MMKIVLASTLFVRWVRATNPLSLEQFPDERNESAPSLEGEPRLTDRQTACAIG